MNGELVESIRDLLEQERRPPVLVDDPVLLAKIRASSVVRQAAGRVIDFSRETYQTTVEDAERYPLSLATAVTFTAAPVLTPRNLTALVPVSSYVFDNPDDEGLPVLVEEDLAKVFGLREDHAFLLGSGAGGEPLGLFNQRGAVVVRKRLTWRRLQVMIEWAAAHQGQRNWCLFINPDTMGRLGIDPEDRIGNGRVKVTLVAQLPSWQAGVVNMGETIVGQEKRIGLAVSREGNYWDGARWTSAFQNNQVLVRAVMQHDITHCRPDQILVLGRPPRFAGTRRLLARWGRRLR